MRFQHQQNSHDLHPDIFSIARIETLTETALHEAALIHRHKTFEIVILTEGPTVCRIDTDCHALEAGQICLIRPGRMHALEITSGARGFVLAFASEFFHVSLERSLLLNTCGNPNNHPLEAGGARRNEMIRILRFMEREYNEPGLFRTEALRGLLKILFIYLNRLTDKEPAVRLNRKNQIVEHFLTMLDEKFATLRRPADYAEALAVTTNYLNETVKTVSGFTTSYHIHQRVILEAKRMAVYSDHSMKQVASSLGFDDVCHFSRFFKKASGQGFTEFKQKTLIGVM